MHHNDDNIICTNRGDITKEEEETCIKALRCLIGNGRDLIDGGATGICCRAPASITVDADDNVWITTNGDGRSRIQARRKAALQIGNKGVYDTSVVRARERRSIRRNALHKRRASV